MLGDVSPVANAPPPRQRIAPVVSTVFAVLLAAELLAGSQMQIRTVYFS